MQKSMRPVFSLDLNFNIVSGLVTVGKYDGEHSCITAATSNDKVIIHSPFKRFNTEVGRIVRSEANREISILNVNQTIRTLTTGNFNDDTSNDSLIIGTETHILAYNVCDNKDIFHRPCADSVRSVILGSWLNKGPLVIVGGNSSLCAIDYEGNEVFWTSIGDTVTSLLLLDWNGDGIDELLVGCEDFSIKILQNDGQVIFVINETEIVTGLTAISDRRFAYSVSNGTVGVYEQDVRLWRIKSKHFAIDMVSYDLLGQDSQQLLTGWSNGKIDCRSLITGEIFLKDVLESPIAGVVVANYRDLEQEDLILITNQGKVCGFTTCRLLSTTQTVFSKEMETIRELLEQKQALLTEIKCYEENTKFNELELLENSKEFGVIPASTRLHITISNSIATKANTGHVDVFIATNNFTIIRAVIIFAEGIFNGESSVTHPAISDLSPHILVPLVLPRDIAVDVHIKTLVGYNTSQQFHVFEVIRQIPRYSMYAQVETTSRQSDSFVEFHIDERLQRICIWLNQNFLLEQDLELEKDQQHILMDFKCLRDGSDLMMRFNATGKTTIYTENINLAADLVQNIAAFLKINQLESTASFIREEEQLVNLVGKLVEIEEASLALKTDFAEKLEQMRTLIMKADDYRSQGLFIQMQSYYKDLQILNVELVGEHKIRMKNYLESQETMKAINSIIQMAARLRVGPRSASIIEASRAAMQDNNIEKLIKIIQNGIF